MDNNKRHYSTVIKTNSCWFLSDTDYEDAISKGTDIEIDNHTFEVRNPNSDKAYIHSFATNIAVKPISQFEKKKIEYDEELCEEIYERGYTLGDDILDYSDEITAIQFEQWLKDNHCHEYIKYQQDRDYKQYNADKVCEDDLKDFLIQPREPSYNPFKQYVKEHGNFMNKKCPYTYYAYNTKYNHYCILHLITGETKQNVWTKTEMTKIYAVQQYSYNEETGKVNKLFICGKPHVEVYKGEDEEKDKVIICVESFVKAFTLWNSLKKKHTIITTHSKYIRENDLRWINEHYKGYNLAILCDTDEETREIVLATRTKYNFYNYSDRNLKAIFGILGNKKGVDINDSTRTAIIMCKNYFKQLEELKTKQSKLMINI